MPNAQPPSSQLDCFAITAPGLERICAAELRSLGLEPRIPRDGGGVSWRGDASSVARANLWLRTASRVIVRAARFGATAFYELELQAKRVMWERFISPGSVVALRVTCRKSKLYHSAAVAERIAESIGRRVSGVKMETSAALDREDSARDDAAGSANRQLFIVRLLHDECTVSADSSGALLHLRGYRQAIGKAPLRETLAAAMLLGARWSGESPLVDPMCGSGTIPIEAAMLARRMAPGRARTFAFTHWPAHDARAWRKQLDDAQSAELPQAPVAIAGSDRDAGAIAAAGANAERAGVRADIELDAKAISAMSEPAAADATGLIACNPPYGVRVGDRERLRDLYAQLGNVVRRSRPGWQVALLSADRTLERQTRLTLEERFRTSNGGIPVRLMIGVAGGRLDRKQRRVTR
jgi:putative N6-adenine-specific DNA methylase